MAKRIREADPESLPFPPFQPFPPDLWDEPLPVKNRDTYRILRIKWEKNARALTACQPPPTPESIQPPTPDLPDQPDSEPNDDRSQDQNRTSRQQSQRQQQEPDQNQTPDEPAKPTAQKLAPEIEKRRAGATVKPWVLLLTTCTANLALENKEHSISVIINICAIMLRPHHSCSRPEVR